MNYKKFITKVGNRRNTIMFAITDKGAIYGGCTPLLWKKEWFTWSPEQARTGKTFKFKFNEQGQLAVFKENGKAKGEILQSEDSSFIMDWEFLISTVNYKGASRAVANYDGNYDIPENADSETLLCGEKYPTIRDVEIYHLKN